MICFQRCLEEVGSINRIKLATKPLAMTIGGDIYDVCLRINLLDEIAEEEFLAIDRIAWGYLSSAHRGVSNFFQAFLVKATWEVLWQEAL